MPQVQKLADRRLSIGGLRAPTESSDSQENSSVAGSSVRVGSRPDIGRASAPHSSWAAGHLHGGSSHGGPNGYTTAAAGGGGGSIATAANRRASADVGAATNGWTTASAALGQQVRGVLSVVVACTAGRCSQLLHATAQKCVARSSCVIVRQ
jgi:hypothetical protein